MDSSILLLNRFKISKGRSNTVRALDLRSSRQGLLKLCWTSWMHAEDFWVFFCRNTAFSSLWNNNILIYQRALFCLMFPFNSQIMLLPSHWYNTHFQGWSLITWQKEQELSKLKSILSCHPELTRFCCPSAPVSYPVKWYVLIGEYR